MEYNDSVVDPHIDLGTRLEMAKKLQAEIDALNQAAWDLRDRDLHRAQELGEQAYALSTTGFPDQVPYLQGLAHSLLVLGFLAISTGDYGKGLSQLLEAKLSLESLPNPGTLVHTLNSIGWAHFNLGNISEALDHLFQALEIAHEISDPPLEADVLNSLSGVFAEMGNSTQALETLFQALPKAENDPRLKMLTLNNLAMTQKDVGQYEEALENALQSVQIASQLGLVALESITTDTVAQVYLAMKNYPLAKHYLDQAMVLAKQSGLESYDVERVLSISQVYLGLGQVEAAIQATQQGLQMAEERGIHRLTYQYHELLSNIFEQQGQLEPALQHFKSYQEIKNKVYNDEIRKRIENLMIVQQVETARMEAEILRLKNSILEQEVGISQRDLAEMEKLATTDPLTGLFNRRHFFTLGNYEFQRARSEQRPISVLMLDIDRFKLVNDHHGHHAGDLVLVAISRIVHSCLRATDLVGRYGGEEFTILLAGSSTSDALQIAERIRTRISMQMIRIGHQNIHITASLGVAGDDPAITDLEAAISRADRALYAAKEAGRNRTIVFSSGLSVILNPL